MPNTIAAVHLPEALRNGNSALVKLAGKIDSFSLVLWRTPENQLKQEIAKEYHAMVFSTRKEVRKYCPKYRYFTGEGILDFSTDCASGQLESGDLGKPPQPKRGSLCRRVLLLSGRARGAALRNNHRRGTRSISASALSPITVPPVIFTGRLLAAMRRHQPHHLFTVIAPPPPQNSTQAVKGQKEKIHLWMK